MPQIEFENRAALRVLTVFVTTLGGGNSEKFKKSQKSTLKGPKNEPRRPPKLRCAPKTTMWPFLRAPNDKFHVASATDLKSKAIRTCVTIFWSIQSRLLDFLVFFNFFGISTT